jgi:hypothetical protein
MFNSGKQIGMATVVGLAVLASTGPDVHGQNGPRRTGQRATLPSGQANLALTVPLRQALLATTLGLNPYAGAANFAGLGSAFAAGLNPNAALSNNAYASLYGNPYGGGGLGAGAYPGAGQYSSPYGNPYSSLYPDPNGAYLEGTANVINAQGRFMVSEPLAYQIREQARGERVANRRKAFDQYLYEREKTPSVEEERQRAQLDQLNRSRNNPPVTEIWSGKALNDILNDLRKLAASGDLATGRTVPLPLDEAGLKHINVTKDGGSIALLRNDGYFDWPLALNDPESEGQREQLLVCARAAVRQAEFNGRVDPVMLREMAGDVDGLHKHLRQRAKDLSPSEYIEANTFLRHFDQALRALCQPDVGNHFTGKYALKAGTVAELVQQMVDKGLQFAPALPGDESAYSALHQALATYDRAERPQVTRR